MKNLQLIKFFFNFSLYINGLVSKLQTVFFTHQSIFFQNTKKNLFSLGNLVTCEYWDYVWLNEGFASYVEYIIADKVWQFNFLLPISWLTQTHIIHVFNPIQILPEWRILEQFTVEDMHPVMLNDVKPKTHAMTRPVNTPEEITKIYDFVAYPKAASVIRMIEYVMSTSIFKIAIQRYLDERCGIEF